MNLPLLPAPKFQHRSAVEGIRRRHPLAGFSLVGSDLRADPVTRSPRTEKEVLRILKLNLHASEDEFEDEDEKRLIGLLPLNGEHRTANRER